MPNKSMIIDAHTHIGAVGEDKKHVSVSDLLASMQEANIDHSIVIALDCLDKTTPTQTLLKECEAAPQLHVVGSLYFAKDIDKQSQELLSLYKAGRIAGIKLLPGYEDYYPNDKRLSEFYEQCQVEKIPVIFHTGVLAQGSKGILKQIHPLEIDEVANQFPDLTIVMAHLGNPWVVDAAAVMVKNPNIYADLSGFFPEYEAVTPPEVDIFSGKIQQFINFAGDLRKCMFGTDYPLYNQKEYLEAVQQLNLEEDEKELVMWKNAVRIFSLGDL